MDLISKEKVIQAIESLLTDRERQGPRAADTTNIPNKTVGTITFP
jgi:hypothetical protein